jgi:hypothetical protein
VPISTGRTTLEPATTRRGPAAVNPSVPPQDRTAGERLSARLRAEDGISLVEVLVAIFMLAVGVLALAGVATASLASLARSEVRQDAYNAASQSIEQLRAYHWDEVALVADDPLVGGVTEFDPISGTIDAPGTGPEVVFEATGRVTGLPHQFDSDRMRLRTYVTVYHHDPDDPNAEQRLITVVAEFERAGTVEIVRQSTLITRARWGVAQPAFSVSPINGLALVERTTETCIEHEITNRGSTDAYRFEVPTVDQTPPGWQNLVVWDIPPEGLTPPEHLTEEEAANYDEPRLVHWQDPASDLHYTRQYTFNTTFTVAFCYLASAGTVDDIDLDDTVSILVESELLPEQNQELLHTVLIEDERVLYLRARGQESWDASEPYDLTADDPTALSLVNFDTSADDHPGLTLNGGETAVWRVDWDLYRTITEARLWLRTSSVDALDGWPVNATPDPNDPNWTEPDPDPVHQRYDVELRVVDADGVTVAWRDERFEVTHEHTDADWLDHVWDLDLASPLVIEAGQTLELAITCAWDDCVLGFDAVDPYDARLRVVFP